MLKNKNTQEVMSSFMYKFLLFAAFFEGGAVMAVELTGAKIIAPFYGNTIYVWTSVLAVTLGGLGFGYLIGGGKWFKNKGMDGYFSIYLVSAFTVVLMPIVARGVLEATLEMEVRTGVLLASFVFLFPPLFCFGLLSPVLVRIISTHMNDSGKAAGTVYAVSTFGGIFFTLMSGYFFIPTFGIKLTVYLIAGLTLFFPLVYYVIKKNNTRSITMLFVMTVLVFFQYDQLKSNEKGRISLNYFSEGYNGQLMVAEDSKSGTRVLINNCISQTMYDCQREVSTWPYVNRIFEIINENIKQENILVAGLGGGLLVKKLVNDKYKVDVVDIDDRLPFVADKYFNCKMNSYQFFADDIRHFLNCNKKKYDALVFDLSAGESQPDNVYTLECLKKIKNSITEQGMLVIHFPENFSNDNGFLLASIGRSIKEAGFEVELLNTQPDINLYSEYVFVASKNLKHFKFNANGKPKYFKGVDFSKGIVLNDNSMAMEYLHAKTLIQKRKEGKIFTTKVLVDDGHLLF